MFNPIMVTLKPPGGDNQKINGFGVGGAGDLGLEIMLRPDIHRMVAAPSYNDDDAAEIGEFANRTDLLGSASGRLGFGYAFGAVFSLAATVADPARRWPQSPFFR